MTEASPFRLAAVTLDEHTVVRRSREIEHEREIALYDLLEANSFRPVGSPGGPYNLVLGIEEGRLVFDVRTALGEPLRKVMLSLTAFRRIVKDYFLICESYFKAIGGSQTPYQIEALDMGRRGLHDEGAGLLRDHLKGKIEMDFDTARRLFTLICVLHLKG